MCKECGISTSHKYHIGYEVPFQKSWALMIKPNVCQLCVNGICYGNKHFRFILPIPIQNEYGEYRPVGMDIEYSTDSPFNNSFKVEEIPLIVESYHIGLSW